MCTFGTGFCHASRHLQTHRDAPEGRDHAVEQMPAEADRVDIRTTLAPNVHGWGLEEK